MKEINWLMSLLETYTFLQRVVTSKQCIFSSSVVVYSLGSSLIIFILFYFILFHFRGISAWKITNFARSATWFIPPIQRDVFKNGNWSMHRFSGKTSLRIPRASLLGGVLVISLR